MTDEPLDFNDDLIVNELCEYQSRLDGKLDSGKHASADDNSLPLELMTAMKECRSFLEFLHETRMETEALGQESDLDLPQIGGPLASYDTADTKHNRDGVTSRFELESSEPPEKLAGYALPKRIGRFKIIEQLGFGGFGVVFRGIDPFIRREVAIKIPRPEFLGAQESIDRFTREASIVSQLSHPNIVSIYESGCYEVVPYIVMPYLRGKTLSEWRAEEPDIAPRTAAKIVRELAMAVAHAHERGVLHRDLKPGNVIMTPRESATTVVETDFIPVLTDFGIARCADIDSRLTRSGSMVGTSCYMSPEQADGRTQDITARSDVYGLGTILYELLSGTPPFQSANEAQTTQKILHDAPLLLRSLNSDIPLDLEIICLKCLRKEPARRYKTAEGMAEDLRRFLDGEPILARPMSWTDRIRKWFRQHPTSAAAALVSIIGLFALVCLSLWYNSRLIALLSIAEVERASARRNELNSRQRAYDSDMRNAKLCLDRGNLRQTLKFLDRQRPKSEENDIRDFAWWHLWRTCDEPSRLLGRHEKQATTVALSRTGKVAASGGSDSVICLWDIPSGNFVSELVGHEFGAIDALSFSPDGKHLASAGEDGTVRIWDLLTQKELFVCRDHHSSVRDVQYSPSGDLIASAGSDKLIRLWNPETGEPVGILSGHTDKVLCLAFHPSETTLASGGADATIRLWDLNKGCLDSRIVDGTIRFSTPDKTVRALVFGPDGKSLVAGIANSGTHQISFEDHNFGSEISQHREHANALSMVWPQNGSLIVALGNSEIRVANRFGIESPDEMKRGHFEAVLSIAAPSNGDFLLSASEDGMVRFWPQFQSRSRIMVESEEPSEQAADPRLYSVQWKGSHLALDFQSQQLSIYQMPDQKLKRAFPKNNDDDFVLSPSGGQLLIRRNDGLVKCYEIETGHCVWTEQFSSSQTRARSDSIAVDKSEKFALITVENELLIVSMADSKILHRLTHPGIVGRTLFLESKGEPLRAITTCHDAIVRVWSVEEGKLLRDHRLISGQSHSMGLSDDDRLIAIVLGGNYPVVSVLQLDDMTELAAIPIPNEAGPSRFETNKVAFLAKSKLMIQSNLSLSLWDARENAELLTFPEYDRLGPFAISPDGKQVAIPQRGCIQLIDGRPQKISN